MGELFEMSYALPMQKEFRECLKREDYEVATKVLINTPLGMTLEENAERQRFMREGFLEIIGRLLPIKGESNDYDELGLADEIGRKLELFGKYEGLGNLEEVQKKLNILREYEAIGSVEYIMQCLRKLDDAQDEISRVGDFQKLETILGMK